jgi:hypothetical protein
MMMLKLPDNYAELKRDVNKELVAFIDAMALKHAKIPYTLNVEIDQVQPKNFVCYNARFYDPRFPSAKEVGHVMWDYGRSVNSYEYVVSSRLIQNAKYSAWNSRDFSSARTKDMAKAIKKAMEFVIPYQWQEFADESRELAQRQHRMWAEENSSVARNFNFSHKDVAEELKHLMEQGVVFKTEAFKQAVGSIPMYEEYRSRINKPAKMECVMYALGKVNMTNGNEAREYPNDEALPEEVRQKVGLLKLLEEKKLMPNVGFKFDANTFWIYTETNN